jgi:signal transduction histidine kinase/DNA-binding response OmpR family regulator
MKRSKTLLHFYLLKTTFIILLLGLICPLLLQAQPKNKDLIALKKTRNADTIKMLSSKLIAEARKNNDELLEGIVVFLQSKMAYRQGNVASALDLARQSLKYTNQKDSDTYTRASLMVAYMLAKQGKSVEGLQLAFKMLRETDERHWKKMNIYSLVCISDLYQGMGNPAEALPYALKSSKEALEIRDSSMYIIALANISDRYSNSRIKSAENLKKATKYLETVLSPPYLHFVAQTAFDNSRFLGNLGTLYGQANDKRAESTLNQAIAISREHKYTTLQKSQLGALIQIYNDQHRYAEAVKLGEQAIALDPGSGNDKSMQKSLFNKLREGYEGLGNYKLAYEYYGKSVNLQDSLSNLEKIKDAAELDKKYHNDERLILADSETKLFHQQRNYLIVLAILIALALVATYYWLVNKRKREAALMIKEREQLEKLDAIKTRFFSNISHELRTPLTLIMGPAGQLLEKDIEDEAQEKHYLKTIINNGNKLLNLVNELLDLGKLQAGKLQLKLKPVALSSFIKIMFEGFTSAAVYKQINYTLVTDIDEQLFADIDKEKFEKISNNLISNAVKFTRLGGSITVTAATTADTINFSVANTGTGIHPDDLPNVFDRYYQGNNEAQQLQGGTGIGLAIVREFTELMGGSISIDNIWNESVTFRVSIPLINPELRITEKPVVIESEMPYTSPVNHAKSMVMIVEDNHVMARYIASVLNPTHTLIIASNGVEALSMLNTMQQLPQLIISDVMMPEMDGFTLLQTLKQNDTFCTIPVIMLTALTDNQHKLKALNIGVDDYLTKPFLTDELVARVTNLISNAAARFEVSNPAMIVISENNNEAVLQAEEAEIIRVSPADLLWLSELEAEVRKHVGKTDLNLYMLSDAIAISERQLFRRIKAITGLTPNKYIRTIRLQIAREAIESGRYRTIAEVSYVAGFETPAYFAKLFKEYYGREVGELL